MRKGSKEAKAWGRKMKRLRASKTKKRKRKKSTRKGQIRKTSRRAYEGLKKNMTVRKKRSKRKYASYPFRDAWSF